MWKDEEKISMGEKISVDVCIYVMQNLNAALD